MRNLNYEIWEGWTIQDFIDELEPNIKTIMNGYGLWRPFENKDELKKYIVDNQPYYKKEIPEVVEYFSTIYNIK